MVSGSHLPIVSLLLRVVRYLPVARNRRGIPYRPAGRCWTSLEGGNRGMCGGGSRSLRGYGDLRLCVRAGERRLRVRSAGTVDATLAGRAFEPNASGWLARRHGVWGCPAMPFPIG